VEEVDSVELSGITFPEPIKISVISTIEWSCSSVVVSIAADGAREMFAAGSEWSGTESTFSWNGMTLSGPGKLSITSATE